MTDAKLDKNIKTVYALLWIVLTASFVFEVPKIVFWTPTVLFALFVLYRLYYKEPLNLTVSTLVLFIFCIVYVYFNYNPEHSIYYQSYTHIQAALFFVIGYNFFNSKEPLEKRFQMLEKYILIVAVMYMIYVSVTYGNYLRHMDTAPEKSRHYWSIWYPNQVIKAATGFSTSMLFAVSWGAYSVFFSNKWYKKLIGAAFILYCVGFNIITGTRLLVYLTPVILVAEFFVWIVFSKKKYKLGIGITAATVLVLTVAVIIIALNKDVLTQRFGDTVFGRFFKMGLDSNSRWSYLKNVISDFSFTYMGGGVHSKTFGTPHNFWFYVYDYGGIVSFAVYCVFTLMMVVNFIRFLFNKNVPTNVKFFISTIFGTIFVEFMIEDLILPLPSYIILVNFIFGIISGLSVYKTKEQPQQINENPEVSTDITAAE